MNPLGRRLVVLILLVAVYRPAVGATAETSSNRSPALTRRPLLSIEAGPLVTFRTMTIAGDADRIRAGPGPYAGLYTEGDLRLAALREVRAELRLEGEVLYAVARSIRPSGVEEPMVAETVQGSGRIRLDRYLGPRVTLGVGLGATVSSFTLEANPEYTGDRYVGADVTTALYWSAVPEHLTVEVGAAVQPLVTSDHSGGAHGAARGFGARLEGELQWTPFPASTRRTLRRLRLSAHYRFQRFRTQFPDSSLDQRGAVGREDRHLAGLSIGYSL